MNAAEIIKKDLDAIYIGNLSTVDDDLTLPENGKYGAQFTWETGEEVKRICGDRIAGSKRKYRKRST